jgi:hypothetical protein
MVGLKHPTKKRAARFENHGRELVSGVILARRPEARARPWGSESNMQTDGVLLVAVERGAALPTWIGHCQDRVSDVFVLVGNTDEPIDTRLKRLDQRLSHLAESEYRRGLVVIVAAPELATPEAEAVRMQVADRLLSRLTRLGEGKLLLLTDENASLDSRIQLLSMAGTLAQQVRGTKLSISVRFGARNESEPPPEIFGLADPPPTRRMTRRPPHESGPVPKPSFIPTLHKAPAIQPKRRLSNAG